MTPSSPFTDPLAVETWDAMFRWREDGQLRDRTIDDTWARIVHAVANAEGSAADRWARHWIDALRRWRWLPGESLLRSLGTRASLAVDARLDAALNLRAFVRPAALPGMRPELDTLAILQAAASALRFLDDARLLLPSRPAAGVRLGMFGMADALVEMGIAYDSAAALQVAREAVVALAHGALQGAVELARERGGKAPDRARMDALPTAGLPRSLIEDALRWGVRHDPRTTIAPTPVLARLANNASDAADPRCPRQPVGSACDDAMPLPSPAAQLRLRMCIQPWIDRVIDYPLLVDQYLEEPAVVEAIELARLGALPSPRFRACPGGTGWTSSDAFATNEIAAR